LAFMTRNKTLLEGRERPDVYRDAFGNSRSQPDDFGSSPRDATRDTSKFMPEEGPSGLCHRA
jgi:hypothetical protein